jgi:hypothetical protein
MPVSVAGGQDVSRQLIAYRATSGRGLLPSACRHAHLRTFSMIGTAHDQRDSDQPGEGEKADQQSGPPPAQPRESTAAVPTRLVLARAPLTRKNPLMRRHLLA